MSYECHWWILAFRAEWIQEMQRDDQATRLTMAFQFMADEALMRQEFGYAL
jgi:hypothetical protein